MGPNKASGSYRKAMSLARRVDCFFVKLEAFCADPQPALRTLKEHVVDGISPERNYTFGVRA